MIYILKVTLDHVGVTVVGGGVAVAAVAAAVVVVVVIIQNMICDR